VDWAAARRQAIGPAGYPREAGFTASKIDIIAETPAPHVLIWLVSDWIIVPPRMGAGLKKLPNILPPETHCVRFSLQKTHQVR